MQVEQYIMQRDKIRKAYKRGILTKQVARLELVGLFAKLDNLDDCLNVADRLLETDVPEIMCDEGRLAEIEPVSCGGES